MTNSVDVAINGLNTLQHKAVIKELTSLVLLYIHARARNKAVAWLCERQAQWGILTLSDGSRTVLEAALKE